MSPAFRFLLPLSLVTVLGLVLILSSDDRTATTNKSTAADDFSQAESQVEQRSPDSPRRSPSNAAPQSPNRGMARQSALGRPLPTTINERPVRISVDEVKPYEDQSLTIDERHRVFCADKSGPANPARVRVKISSKSGVYTGSFQVLDTKPFMPEKTMKRVAKFRGIILPGATEARSCFLLAELGDPGAAPPVANNKSPILSDKVTLAKD